MALTDYKSLPLIGVGDGIVYVNKNNILEVRVIQHNNEYYVQLTMVAGKHYVLDITGSPFATYAEAVIARDALTASL